MGNSLCLVSARQAPALSCGGAPSALAGLLGYMPQLQGLKIPLCLSVTGHLLALDVCVGSASLAMSPPPREDATEDCVKNAIKKHDLQSAPMHRYSGIGPPWVWPIRLGSQQCEKQRQGSSGSGNEKARSTQAEMLRQHGDSEANAGPKPSICCCKGCAADSSERRSLR